MSYSVNCLNLNFVANYSRSLLVNNHGKNNFYRNYRRLSHLLFYKLKSTYRTSVILKRKKKEEKSSERKGVL